MAILREGDYILIRLPSKEMRSFKLDAKANINMGKFGSFPASEIIGKHTGFTYEIADRKLVVQEPERIDELEDTDANNELITDTAAVQPLTYEEIEALKTSGARATDIIKAQIEQHANYDLKTEYSKDKYRRRKEAKFSKVVTVIDPTIFNVCEYWYDRDPVKLRYLRSDSLGMMLNLANVCPGQRVLVVDDTGGMILAGVLDRLGGRGKALVLSDASNATGYPCLSAMNFSPEISNTLDMNLNWLHTEIDWEPLTEMEELIPLPMKASGADTTGESATKRKIHRENLKIQKKLDAHYSVESSRDEYFSGDWNSVLISSKYEPFSIVQRILPHLGGSANIVIQSPYLQTLTDTHVQMKTNPQDYLAPSITEGWLRRYQVLPGRTHPEMTTSGTGGFVLHAIRIFGDRKGSSMLASERRIQRQRLAEAKKRKKAEAEGEAARDGDGGLELEKVDALQAGNGSTSTPEVAEDVEMHDSGHSL